MVIVDGRPASSYADLGVGAAERLSRLDRSTPCAECGGPAPPGSPLTGVWRTAGGMAAWRRCGDCWELLRRDPLALPQDAADTAGLGPDHWAWHQGEATTEALRSTPVPRWAVQDIPPLGEEFGPPLPARWAADAVPRWARRLVREVHEALRAQDRREHEARLEAHRRGSREPIGWSLADKQAAELARFPDPRPLRRRDRPR